MVTVALTKHAHASLNIDLFKKRSLQNVFILLLCTQEKQVHAYRKVSFKFSDIHV